MKKIAKCVGIGLGMACSAQAESRHIQYDFTLQNSRGTVIEQAEFWTYAPVKQTGAQTVKQLTVSHPYETIEDSVGNQILHFIFTNFPPYGTKIVRIEADLNMQTNPLVSPKPGAVYTQAAPYIEINDPAFMAKAPVFKTGSASQTVEQIFHWVSGHIKDDGYVQKPRGALYALTEGKGDCTEYMDLFIALCRRAGIPGRGIGGYICTRNTILSPEGYHNWAEFYEDGRWQLADPQRGVLRDQSENYIALREIAPEPNVMGEFPRFRFSGDGLTVRMN